MWEPFRVGINVSPSPRGDAVTDVIDLGGNSCRPLLQSEVGPPLVKFFSKVSNELM